MSYDTAGRVTGWTYDRGTASATYASDSGLLASIASPDGVSVSFLYDGWVPVGMAWSGLVSGEVRRTVDPQLQPTAETVNGGTPLAFGYDESGLLTSIGALALARDSAEGQIATASLGEVEVAYEYDDKARLVGLVATSAGSEVFSVGYARDALGRVVAVERTAGAGAEESVFTYDAAGRLASVERGGTTTNYQYDASGNRLTVDATYDDRDQMLAWSDATFRYAPDGTLLERRVGDGATSYDFDDLGSLRSVALDDGGRVDYVLDASGRRIGRMRDGALTEGYLYDVEDRIVALTDGSGQVVARFAYDDLGRLALVERDGQELLVVTDQLGSPIALLDGSTGELVAQMTYDAWGGLLADSQPTLIPFGFAGGLLDRDTGLLHFGARDYDPTVGRWTAPDPLRYGGGDLNLYRYAFGDPVNLVDPTGTTPCPVGSCAGSAGPEVRSPNYAGGKRSGGTGGGRPGRGGGTPSRGGSPSRGAGPAKPSSPQFPPGSLTCIGGFCIPKDPSEGDDPIMFNPFPPGSLVCVDGACVPMGPPASPQSPENAAGPNVNGEPHVITLDGTHYDFQAAGEFIVTDSADGLVQVQTRFEPPASSTSVTRATGLALLVNGDRVAFYANPDRALVVNGEVIDRAEYARTLPGGGVIERHGTEAFVVWPDGTTLTAHVYARFINFGLEPSAAIAASLVGIIGDRDGDPADDMTTRGGQVVDPDGPNFEQLLYGEFANSWRITQEESLFDYEAGESTATFTRPEIPTEPATIDSLDEETRTNAEAVCRAMGVTTEPILSDCVLDVGITGDPTYAGSAATVDAALERAGALVAVLSTPISLGQTITGDLEAGARDRYRLTMTAGQVVYLDGLGECVDELSWHLLRPSGGEHGFGPTCTDIGRRVLDEAGDWIVEIYSNTQSTGAYSFTVIDAPAVVEQTATLGQTVSGTIAAVGEWHRYRLTVTAGQVVYLDALGECVDELSWHLLRPSGGEHGFALTCNDIGRRVLDEAGDWIVEIYSNTMATGAYSFTAISAPAVLEQTMTLGQTVSSNIAAAGEWHRYRLTMTAGQVVYLDGLGECVDELSWHLLRPSGGEHGFGPTCTDIGRRVLDEAGDWIVEIYSNTQSTGAYSFTVIDAPAVVEQTATLGQTVSGTIAAVGEWHRYRLTMTAGQVVYLDGLGECVDELSWHLLRPSGGEHGFALTCNDIGRRVLDEAGDWIVEIYSNTQSTGAYSFIVTPSQ